jgi:hypothetical protein
MNDIFLYHITDIRNLENILRHQSILSKNRIDELKTGYINIAYEGIQDRRKIKAVPMKPSGNLHDYVPFYFAPRSPMLYAIHTRQVEGYNEEQDSIIYLVIRLSKIVEYQLVYVYTDGHPIISYTRFYNDLNQLNSVIDWDIMKAKYWHNTVEDGDRKRRRQAEFLIHQSVPFNLIEKIAIYDYGKAQQVKDSLTVFHQEVQVLIDHTWYY